MTPEPTLTALPPPPPTAGDPGEPWLASAADLLAAARQHLDAAQHAPIPTGHPDLGAVAPGTLSALVVTPGAAATADLITVAYHAAHRHRFPTLLYPLRSTLAQIAGHLADIHTGEVGELRHTPLHITVGSPITATRIHFDAVDPDLEAPQLIVVDAVDLLLPAGAARDLKHLALELNVAIICSATARDDTAGCVAVSSDVAAAADTIVALQPTLPTPPSGAWRLATGPASHPQSTPTT